MLVSFEFSNYRSFRDATVLSMEAEGLKEHKDTVIEQGREKILPCVAVYGKNGGGKSNVIRAFWLGVQFIRNAQLTQHEKASIPVRPFALDDDSRNRPTFFQYTYILDGVKYCYGFAATKKEVTREYLYHWPKRTMATIFDRSGQTFSFPKTNDKRRKEVIASAVAPNQLYFAVACTLNFAPCIQAMRWFRESVFFSRDFVDIPQQLPVYSGDENMLKTIVKTAQKADVGIEDMSFEFRNREISIEEALPSALSQDAKSAFSDFIKALSSGPNDSETKLTMNEVKATSYHYGIGPDGMPRYYPLDLTDESDGTRKLMSIAPAMEEVLSRGGLLAVDELEKELHPLLVKYILARFQSKKANPKGAQLIFTTHSTELLDMNLMRKDQIYFTDKKKESGISELYAISDMGTRTGENIRKGYLLGKYGATPEIDMEDIEEG